LVERGRDTYYLLEVVQHQQSRGLREVLGQGVEGRPRSLDGRSHNDGDARQHQLGLSDRSERDEYRTARRTVVELLTHGDCQPGLADAARTGEGDQPHLG
jgi:hypothetical protein